MGSTLRQREDLIIDEPYLKSLFGLEGRVAVLTGGGGLLCSGMACALARAGARLAVLDLNLAAAEAVAGQIISGGGEALALSVDVLERGSVESALAGVLDRLGRVDILINGVGGHKKQAVTSPDLSFFDISDQAFLATLGLNVLGTLIPCQVFGRQMAAQQEGVILNIASASSFRPLANVPAYSAAKAAVQNLTQWLAVHMAQNYSSRIRVNALAPGFFLTELNRFMMIDAQTGALTARAQAILAHTPMGRFGVPDDLLGTVLWLVSPGAAFVNGAVIAVDGGFTAQSGV